MEQLTTESALEGEALDPAGPALPGLGPEGAAAARTNPLLQSQIKQIKPLLSGSSRLGRALAELFGLLVKLCVGSPLRQRRGQVALSPTPYRLPLPSSR
jgi:E3 ubiquitin-protein ligase HUWE1